MIASHSDIEIESSGILNSFEMGIRPENMGTILKILRSQIYSDKPAAILREIASNSLDAHIETDQPDRPIKVVLPSTFDPQLKIRDFGAGLSQTEVEEIFVNYGASTKRSSNKTVGLYGIGSKSPFSYVDAFSVNSYQKGICNSYGLFIDESQRGKMSLMDQSKTSEPDGLEVVVPIQNQDINAFREKAVNFFRFWSVLPEFENLTEMYKTKLESFRNEIPAFHGSDWKVFNDGRECFAIMGNVSYRIDKYVWGPEMTGNLKKLLDRGCYLYFNIGDFDVTAPRESVEYTAKSKAVIIKLLEAAYKTIEKEIVDKFSGCKTLWDAKCLFNDVFAQTGKYYYYQDMMNNGRIVFNGKPVNGSAFRISDGIKNSVYSKKRGARYNSKTRVRKEAYAYSIGASPKSAVVIDDVKIENGIMSRIVPLIEDGKAEHVYLIQFTDDAERKTWEQQSGFDGPTINLSSLPKISLSQYYPRDSAYVSHKSPLAHKKVLVLNTDSLKDYHTRCSEYWSEASIDVEKDSGVYLETKSYKYLSPYGIQHDPSDISASLSQLEQAGIQIPVIYGVKHGALSKLANNPNMVKFHVWVQKEVEALIKIKTQELLDFKEGNSFWVSEPNFATYLNRSKGSLTGDMKAFFDIVSPYTADAKKVGLFALATQYNIPITGQTTVSWLGLFGTLQKKYPLIFTIINNVTTYNWDSKGMNEYISLVDKSLTNATV